MARGSLWQIYKKRVKPPIFDASNVHSRAFGFVFVPVYRCFPAIYRAKKRNTKKKSANFVAKVPVKRRKTGSFSAKAARLRTPLGFPPFDTPLPRPRRSPLSPPPVTRLPDLSAPPPAGAGGVFPHTSRCHTKCSCRSRSEGRSFGIARPHARRHPVHRRRPRKNAAHDREAVRKMPYRKTRTRIRRFEPRKRPHRRSTAF